MNTHSKFKIFQTPGLRIIGITVLASLLMGACGLLRQAPALSTDEMVATAAAQTVQAQLTQIPLQTAIAQLTQWAVQPTQVTQPSQPAASPTLVFTPTAVIPVTANTVTPQPTPTNTPVPIPCNAASFVKDVSIPDGTVMAPGAGFTKTWRVKNIGTCTWTSDYELVYSSGDQMKAADSVKLGASVKPGETIDISVKMTAPSTAGEYTGYWKMRSADGKVFSFGAAGKTAIWVEIKVAVQKVFYNFVDKMCDATWRNDSGAIACPGTEGASSGAVVKLDAPKMENGGTDNEAALGVEPEHKTDGIIAGEYPSVEIKNGDRFRAVIGCRYNEKDCNTKFLLQYVVEGSSTVNTLGSWIEKYDNMIYKVDVDLSSLAGKKVHFILRVESNGPSTDDQVFWLQPRLMR